jgi:hypothetical protein
MPKIVRNNAILEAQRLEEEIRAPGPEGEEQVIARPGMWAVYAESEDGYTFKGFITDAEYREKHQVVM